MDTTESPPSDQTANAPAISSGGTQAAGAEQGTRRRIDEITVGERHRRDLGNIDALAASIREIGLLHPIVIAPDGRLIAGVRRLRAYDHHPCRIVPSLR
jgi:ParB/Sulfiredoxin domain